MTETRLPKKILDQPHHFWSLRADCIWEIKTDYQDIYSFWYQGKDTKEASKKHCRETAEKIVSYWSRLELNDSFEQEQWLYSVYEALSTEVRMDKAHELAKVYDDGTQETDGSYSIFPEDIVGWRDVIADCPFTHQQMMLSLRHNKLFNGDTKEITAIHNQVNHSGISKAHNELKVDLTIEHIVQHLQPLLTEEQEESLRNGLKQMSFEVRAIISAMVTSIPQKELKERIGEQMLDGIQHLMDNSNTGFKELIPWWQAVRYLSLKFNWLWKKEKRKLTKLYYRNTRMVPNEWAKDDLWIEEKLERGKTSFQYYGLLPRYLLDEISFEDFDKDINDDGRWRRCAIENYDYLNRLIKDDTKIVNSDGQVEELEQMINFMVNATKEFPYKWEEEEASWIKLTPSELTKYTTFPTPN